MLLQVDNITIKYGKAIAVEGVSLEVPDDRVVTIIGANGAGSLILLAVGVVLLILPDGNTRQANGSKVPVKELMV